MKKKVKKLLKWGMAFVNTSKKRKFYISVLKKNSIKNRTCPGEKEWIHKWSILDSKIDPIYYRLFSSYIGNNINIVPDNICYNIIEPILNPRRYIRYYSDKNIFDRLFPEGTLPRTILRKMGGVYLNAQYEYVDMNDDSLLFFLNSHKLTKIIIKPSLDTSSGVGVKAFIRNSDIWRDCSDEGVLLDKFYLDKEYGDNFIIQEFLEQSSDISKFNESSVNTIRLTLYKSVKTNEPFITSAVMRIGYKGSVVDNAHAGGRFVGIYPNGTLGKVTLDQWGGKLVEFNGINFSNEYKIPNWESIIKFSKSLGKYIPHCKLIALDIMVTKNGEPRLIEYNVSSYSPWLFQFTTSAAFGEYTDEIINYCKDKISSIELLLPIK